MRYSATPTYDHDTTEKVAAWLESLNDELDGNALPVALTIWDDKSNKPVVLRGGPWEVYSDEVKHVYLAQSNDRYTNSPEKAAIIMALITHIGMYGDQDVMKRSQTQAVLTRVRAICYYNLALRDIPDYIRDVRVVGFVGDKAYFRKDDSWVSPNGEILEGEPTITFTYQ
jgi:hypothetical protein